jgi:phosphonate utilization transcriptional regulator
MSDEMSPFQLLRSRSLAGLVQSEIERLILTGELGAGRKLNENDIARRLGVSRGPVRESLRTLEEMGLVRLEKNRGVFVREISAEEAAELYEVRAALDRIVGRRLAARATAEQLVHLRSFVARMDEAAKRGEVDAYHPLNVQFHECLVEFAGNRKLAAMYRRLVNELTLFRRNTMAHFETMATSNAEHHAILDAIASGDSAAAGEAMHSHILASGERTQRALRLYFESDRCGDAA